MSVGSDELLTWIGAQKHLHADKEALFARLAGWKVKKTYTADKARKAFMPLLRRTAEHYVTQGLARSRKAAVAFPTGCRAEAAKDLEEAFGAQFKAGRWAALQHEQRVKDKRTRERQAKAKASKRRRR